jgi:hypothetical protein
MQAHGSKRYVDVVARWHANGYVEPLIVCWPDGRSFQVESVEGTPQSSSFPGVPGRTLRYTVVVDRHRTHLFLEHGADGSKDSARWYVEPRATCPPWSIQSRGT